MLQAPNWVDPDGHLPLNYVFFANKFPLRSSSKSETLGDITLFGRGKIKVFVKVFDSLGAVSTSEPFDVALTQFRLSGVGATVFESASLGGANEDELLDIVSGVIDAVNDEPDSTNASTAVELRKAAFKTLQDVRRTKSNESVTTLDDVARVATSFKKVLSAPEQLDEADYGEYAGFLSDILKDTLGKDLNEGSGTEEQLFEDILEVTNTFLP